MTIQTKGVMRDKAGKIALLFYDDTFNQWVVRRYIAYGRKSLEVIRHEVEEDAANCMKEFFKQEFTV